MRVRENAISNLAEDFYEETDGYISEEESKESKVVREISKLIEGPEIFPVYNGRNTVPQVGECVLINEKECASFSREHGGRYRNENSRRYFGEVVQIHPHIVVLKTDRGMISERIADFKVGIVKYAKLKQFPERPEMLSYNDRFLGTFIKSFESLLEE